jgi:hypothetical protein
MPNKSSTSHQEAVANRRENLRRMIADTEGGATALAKKLGLKGSSYLTHVAGPSPIKDIGEKAARHIESTLNLPAGWMDRLHGPEDQLVEAVLMVAQTARKYGIELAPAALSELALMVHEHAATHAGVLDPDHVARLVKLLKR